MTIHFLPEVDRYDAAVEDAIATCNGDMMGALKALLIVNEHLEAELVELRVAMAMGGTVERRTDQSLH
jgi:S-adenosylmethionine/arginine decarboxylase-like enzyme